MRVCGGALVPAQSGRFHLPWTISRPGDLVLTGTPSGVGRLVPGDTVTAGVAGHVEMAVAVVAS